MFHFTHDCSACERRQLIFPSQVTGAARTDRGTEVAFTCWCGAPQTALRGAARETRTPVAA